MLNAMQNEVALPTDSPFEVTLHPTPTAEQSTKRPHKLPSIHKGLLLPKDSLIRAGNIHKV